MRNRTAPRRSIQPIIVRAVPAAKSINVRSAPSSRTYRVKHRELMIANVTAGSTFVA